MIKNLFAVILIPLVISVCITACSPTDDFFFTKVDTIVVKKYDTVTVSKQDQNENLDSLKEVGLPFNFSFTVQIGSYDNQTWAQNFADKAKENLNINIDILQLDGKLVVCIGSFDNLAKAEAYQKYVQSKGYPEAFIRRK